MRSRLDNAIRRRIFERRIAQLPKIPRSDLVRLGEGYGAWTVPEGVLPAQPICWCVGAGADVTFDLQLMRRYDARVRCLDPFQLLGEMALEQAAGDPRFTFHAVALAAEDGPIEMFGRQDGEHGGVSVIRGMHDGGSFTRPGRRLDSLLDEFGDGRIDLLKMDVEGAEYAVLDSHDLVALGIRALCVEFHHTASFARARRTIERLRSQGFTLVHRHATDLTFAREEPASHHAPPASGSALV